MYHNPATFCLIQIGALLKLYSAEYQINMYRDFSVIIAKPISGTVNRKNMENSGHAEKPKKQDV